MQCLLLVILGATDVQGQAFPRCEHLSIERMEYFVRDSKLEVTIYNSCNAQECRDRHIYTGLMVFASDDTLAIDRSYFGEANPENGGRRTYVLDVWHDFVLSTALRVDMFSLCDSIRYAPDFRRTRHSSPTPLSAEIIVDDYTLRLESTS